MRMPNEGEGNYICNRCGNRVVFPTPDGKKVKIGPFGLLIFPKCPKCGNRKFKRDIRIEY